MLKRETKARARALQLLYAWEQLGRPALGHVVRGLARADARWLAALERAEPLAAAVVARADELDRQIADAAEHWRLERMGVIERNILRIALLEITDRLVPPKVAITEAVRLAHWFGGTKSAPFVNGVLDALARRAGRL